MKLPHSVLRDVKQFVGQVRRFSTLKENTTFRTLASPIHGKSPKYGSVSEAVSLINSNSDIFVHGTSNTPNELLDEVCRQVENGHLDNLRMTHILLDGEIPWTKPEFHGKIRSNCLFICNKLRKSVNQGFADYTPVFLSETPDLFYRGIIPVDVGLFTVTPPDENGFCSLGLTVNCGYDALRVAKKAIALVNDDLPFTYGDSVIHSSHFDMLVRSKRPAMCLPDKPLKLSETETTIGKTIAENLVEDGATLQLGIGAIPDSALSAMKNHKNLGIHSELIGNGVLDLLKCGVITGAQKSIDPGKVVTCFAMGNKEFCNYVNKNPTFEFRSCGYTNDTQVIRKQHKMTAINSAIEVDLTGQVCSDSIGTMFYSGFGGQVDFIYGASVADDGDGKPIIAITSTTPKGVSKIVPSLKPGAGVVTTRGHIRYVVTEYGIAQLWGKTVRQRAYELINIAHPDHREGLEKAAYERLNCMPEK